MRKTTKERIALVLEIFHNITQIPVMVFNKDWLEYASIGHDEASYNIIKSEINDKFKASFNNKIDSLYLDIDDTFSYAAKHINNNLKVDHYFLLGPYVSSYEVQKLLPTLDNINFKTLEAISYSFELLKLLIIDNTTFSKNILEEPLNYNIRKAISLIYRKYYEEITIENICMELSLNKCYFCNLFKKETGITFSQFLNSFRIEKSKELLTNKNLSILDIAIAVGFNNQNYYAMTFKNITGVTPLAYRRHL